MQISQLMKTSGTKKRRKDKYGQVVTVSNDDLLRYGIRGLVGFSAQFHEFKDGQMVEKQTLVVIDECQTLFNSRSWNVKGRSDWISLLHSIESLVLNFC